MKVWIDSDEWYPVYEVVYEKDEAWRSHSIEAEMTEAEIEDCSQAFINFNKWQRILQLRAHPQ